MMFFHQKSAVPDDFTVNIGPRYIFIVDNNNKNI